MKMGNLVGSLKWTWLAIIMLLLSSCKATKILTDGEINENLSAKNIIKGHYNNQLNFNTLRGRLKIDYSDGTSSQGFNVSLRIEKDKAIWISATLGIVKAYITPERVTFYNKLENEYFDGDFTYLSNLLGTELDFEKIQNLLLGEALLDLREKKYEASVYGNTYELKPRKPMELFKTLFLLEPKNFKMAAQQLSQPGKKRVLEIRYKSYQEIDRRVLPNEIAITAVDDTHKNLIDLTFKNIELNRPLNFPYKIPKGFKEIVLK
ncbi:DUF4292 domain-containing protein [Flavobacteriaceae bacterium 3-367]|uniref:DUF4292 domain-containing protein n=1 Tax=Eudoraea algarum TaxID=3417568 RepID=UPI003285F173